MSDTIISVKDLTKVYRLYSHPRYRLKDMFGLLKKSPDFYREKIALDNINLEIKRGEKVSIIGRNGAGKSTLLKLISGIIRPTYGSIDVKGGAHALLQIGTGFHLELTGRENVYAYLAQMGIDSNKVSGCFDEIVEFAELEEYIDQPVKTYSSGMAARLMFSTSTAITPDLLILDEVLSVGDAYFTHKCFNRMSQLCQAERTTLLLVTHSSYDAAKMSDRMIWLDNGKVMLDGEPAAIIKAYEDSIRVQEEMRLRKKSINAIEKASQVINKPDNFIVEIIGKNNRPQPGLIYFSKVELIVDSEQILVPLFDPQCHSQASLDRQVSCWGKATEWSGQRVLPMLNFGTVYHKVVFNFNLPNIENLIKENKISLLVESGSDENHELVVYFFLNGRVVSELPLPANIGRLNQNTLQVDYHSNSRPVELNYTGVIGSGDLILTKAAMYNVDGREIFSLLHGDSVQVVFDYEIKNPSLNRIFDIILVVSKNGVDTACRYCVRCLNATGTNQKKGKFKIDIDKFTVGSGSYSFTVVIAKGGYIDSFVGQFYTTNPDVYYSMRDILEFEIISRSFMDYGTAYLGEASFEVVEEKMVEAVDII